MKSVDDAIKENCYVGITKDSIKGNVKVEGNVLSQCINHAFILAQYSLTDAYNKNVAKETELTNDWKRDIYRDFYLLSYFIGRTIINIGLFGNICLVELSLDISLSEFESFRDYYEKEPYNDTLFSNLYKSNIDFRTFVSRKLIEIK